MSRKAPLALTALTIALIVASVVAMSFDASPATGQEGAEYKGSDSCKSCHSDEYGAWKEMKHSKAWASLTPEQIESGVDDKGGTGKACVACHSTGYGEGGFVSEKETPKLVNVGCESCHGPGGVHVKTMLKAMLNETEVEDKKISKNVGCVGCHNPHIQYKKLYGGE